MSKQKQSLSETISSLLTTAPKNDYSDEEDETTAKFTDMDYDEDIGGVEELSASKFRKQNINILEDLDKKYSGKGCSRKDFKGSDDDSDENSEPNDDDDSGENSEPNDDDDDDNVSENGLSEDEGDSDEEYKSASGEEEATDNESETENDLKNYSDKNGYAKDIGSDGEEVESDDGEEESDNEEDIEGESAEDYSEGEESAYKNIQNTSNSVKKGQCVRNQLQIWENLLETRIQLQKGIVNANKLPTPELSKEFTKTSQEYAEASSKTKKTLLDCLDKLLNMQSFLLNQYSETKTLLKKGNKKAVDKEQEDNSDEEIPSDTEEEKSDNDEENSADDSINIPTKRKKLHDYEKDIKEIHNKYKPYQTSVINKWNEKTRLVAGKTGSSNNPVVDQINHILNDKTRLIKRSQLKKSQYKVIGENTTKEDSANGSDANNDKPRFVEEYNTEIYDDDDFYHQLLRELIEVKSAEVTDPVQLGRQWVQLQNLRSKMKRKIDTKCTKGRKIRYVVHNKLVNFMAPIENSSLSEEAKAILCGSLNSQ